MAGPSTEPTPSRKGDQPDTLATPEGDNEFRPGEPLPPIEPIPQHPRGDQPHSV